MVHRRERSTITPEAGSCPEEGLSAGQNHDGSPKLTSSMISRGTSWANQPSRRCFSVSPMRHSILRVMPWTFDTMFLGTRPTHSRPCLSDFGAWCAFMQGERRSSHRGGSSDSSSSSSTSSDVLLQHNGSAPSHACPAPTPQASTKQGVRSVENGHSVAKNGLKGPESPSKFDETFSGDRQDEGVELLPYPQRSVERGLVGQVMGGGQGKEASAPAALRSSGGYVVVEREEPLLHRDEDLGKDDVADKEEGDESVSVGLLLSSKRGPSLRNGGDPSLGPAFRRHVGSINSTLRAQHLESHAGGDREAVDKDGDDDGDFGGSTLVGADGRLGGNKRGCCRLSGRRLVYLCALCSSLCSILLGYDVGVMSGAKEFIEPDLNLSSAQVEFMVGSLNLVAAFGGLLAGQAADRFGRKPTIALACFVFIVGAGLMSASKAYWILLLGRVITGIGVGCAMVIAPVYITELAPPDVRGMLVSLTDICINFGIVLGFGSTLLCMSIFREDSPRWRSMVGIGTVPPALILLCLSMMPESPRWLIARGQDSEGIDVLTRVLGNEAEASESFRSISQATSSHKEATWMDVLMPTDRAIRAAVLLGVGLGFFQQASGSEAAVYYTPDVLEDKGWSERRVLVGNMGVGGFKLLGEVVAFLLLDRIGRRPLFLVSSVLVTMCLVMVGVAFQESWDTFWVLFWLCMFMFAFSLGLGPVTFVVASEVLPVNLRGKAMSIVIFVNRLMSGLIASSFVTLERTMSRSKAFYFFAVISVVSVFFYYLKVPETRGRTLEEITSDLESSSPPVVSGSRVMSSSQGDMGGVEAGGRHVPLRNTDEGLE